jgi:anti-anti-sigma factor
MPFTVDITERDDAALIRCNGALDVAGCPKLINAFDRVLWRGLTRVVVDVRGVTFIDSTGLGCLLHGAHEADSIDAAFAVIPGAGTTEFLRSTALAQRMELAEHH